MKVLIIPDVHGNWTETIEYIKNNKDKAEKVVLLGDYVDDFDENLNGEVMINGFTELCVMARKEPGKFCICIGNHDLSYISDPHVSGHHYMYAQKYRTMFVNNLDLLNIGYSLDRWVFSHAGFSSAWYNEKIGDKQFNIPNWEELKTPLQKINALFQNGYFSLFDFNLSGKDVTGNSINQGPLWIRPDSLLQCPLFGKQIIGHTELRRYDSKDVGKPVLFKAGRKELVLDFDTPSHNLYYIFDTVDFKQSDCC